MGVLNNTVDTDFIPYLKDEYDVSVGVSHNNLYWPGVDASEYSGGTLGPHIEDVLGEIKVPNDQSMHEQIKEVARIMLGQYFKRKHDNGLYKKFTYEYKETDTGFIYQVYDDMRKSHLRIIFNKKGYGTTIQKFKTKVSALAKFLRCGQSK